MNNEMRRALETGEYICPKCGRLMEFEDDLQETLVCLNCGHDMLFDQYGFSDEEYRNLYPSEADMDD